MTEVECSDYNELLKIDKILRNIPQSELIKFIHRTVIDKEDIGGVINSVSNLYPDMDMDITNNVDNPTSGDVLGSILRIVVDLVDDNNRDGLVQLARTYGLAAEDVYLNIPKERTLLDKVIHYKEAHLLRDLNPDTVLATVLALDKMQQQGKLEIIKKGTKLPEKLSSIIEEYSRPSPSPAAAQVRENKGRDNKERDR